MLLPCFTTVYFTKKYELHTQGTITCYQYYLMYRNHDIYFSDGCLWALLRLLVTGNTQSESETESNHSDVSYRPLSSVSDSRWRTALQLVICSVGLQVSFLTWGALEEKIFTEYVDSEGNVEKFTDSEFLIFVNCILAFAFSGIYLLITSPRIHQTPLYKYIYCSFSNILSSWCQYETLKFVSFPSQVIGAIFFILH